MRSCKELREAKRLRLNNKGLSADNLALLGTLGSVLPALETLVLIGYSGAASPDGLERLVEGPRARARCRL
jgi:hypothetical protein